MTDEPARVPVDEPFATWAAPARGLRLRLELVTIARRVLGARGDLDPLGAGSRAPDAGPGRPPVSDLTRKLVHFLKTEDGSTAVEYAVGAALMVAAGAAAVAAPGG